MAAAAVISIFSVSPIALGRSRRFVADKLDREGRDPFDLLDEIEQSLALDVTPAS